MFWSAGAPVILKETVISFKCVARLYGSYFGWFYFIILLPL